MSKKEPVDQDNPTTTLSSLEKSVYDLLLSNHQVILTGAPGTGKTFTAKKVAEEMITKGLTSDDEKKQAMDKRFKSVQFHPGYDYSDFVVGMKPVLVSAETGKEIFKAENGIAFTTDNGKKDGARTPFVGKTEVSFRWDDGIFKTFADAARKAYDEAEDKEHVPKFVFLIDEINRADLSRVFGELFSLLEEEYRYPNNKGSSITLPNGDSFVIPKNLYIIGTMNDIDRSVESMDFALRRRFAWKEVKPEDTVDGILGKIPEKDTLRAKMEAVNSIIRSAEMRLGDQYQLGGAIFAKLEKYVGNKKGTPKRAKPEAFDHLWENHIKIILLEYLRGRSDSSLSDLRKAFDAATKDGPSSVEDADWTGKRIKISFPDGSSIEDKVDKKESVTTLLTFVERVCEKEGAIKAIREAPALSGSKNKFLIDKSEWDALAEKKSWYKPIMNSQYYVLKNTQQKEKVRHIQTISTLLNLGVTVTEVKP